MEAIGVEGGGDGRRARLQLVLDVPRVREEGPTSTLTSPREALHRQRATWRLVVKWFWKVLAVVPPGSGRAMSSQDLEGCG